MTSARSRYALNLVLATGVALSAGAQTRPPRAQCYRLEVSAWRPALDADAPYHRLPSVIRLDTLAWPQGGWHLAPNIAYPRAQEFPATPRWDSAGDTIRLLWSNGYTPTRVSLVRSGEVLVGHAVAETDVHASYEPPRPRASVTARPTKCATR